MRFSFRQHMDVYIYRTTDHNGIMRMQQHDVKNSDTLSRHAQQDYNMAADRTSLLLVFFFSHFPHVFFIFFSLSFLRTTTSKYHFETTNRDHGFNYTTSFCPIRNLIVSLFPFRNTYSFSFFVFYFLRFPYFLPRFIHLLLKRYLLKLSFFFLFSIRCFLLDYLL